MLTCPKLDSLIKPLGRLEGAKAGELSTVLTGHFPTMFDMFQYETVNAHTLWMQQVISFWLTGNQEPMECTHLFPVLPSCGLHTAGLTS